MARSRLQLVLGIGVLGIGLLVTFIAGLWAFMSLTATPIHPNAEDVPTATPSTVAPKWADRAERARQIVRAHLVEHNLPGLSVAVGVGDDLVWADALGFADLENRVPVRLDTRFRIGTASIPLTSAAAGLLLEKNALRLDDEIQKYVPEFPRQQWPVTVRQVMAHLAGVVPDEGDEEPVWKGCERTLDGVKRFADRALLFEPGTLYRFSSYDWILMSAAIESASGEPFLTFMRKAIFEPLGMTDTKTDSAAAPLADAAAQYFPRFASDPYYGPQSPDAVNYSCFSGASGFLSTPTDLVRFGLAVNHGTLLQPATVHLLQTTQRVASGAETGYGLGWDLETADLSGAPARFVGHDGDIRGGIAGSFWIVPERGIVVAVLSNISYADTFTLATKVAEAFASGK